MTFADDSPPSPLAIPRLVITPSTPQDDPLIPYTPSKGRRPTLNRSQSLLDQIDSSSVPLLSQQDHRRKELLSPIITSPIRQSRAGKGTAASLILVALAFMLVISSALLNPETVTGLLHSEKMWIAKGRWMTESAVEAGGQAASPSPLGRPAQYANEIIDESALPGLTFSAHGHTQNQADDSAHETAGPIMSHDTWRSYLRRREQVTGRPGPTAHLEAWDFH